MKTQEEIEKLTDKWYTEKHQMIPSIIEQKSFIHGYTQCQKDMADKKYTEEDMILFAFDTYHYISGIMKVPFNKVSENRTHAEENLKEFIKNNKQD